MAEFIYVDNSNLFIEGKRVSAVAKGLADNIQHAMDANIIDNSYNIDFGKLYQFLTGGESESVKRCYLFGSRPPPNDTLWEIAKSRGFEVVVENRNIAGKEKRIDTGIVSRMVGDAHKFANRELDTITLVAGDGDYVPPIEDLQEDGFKNVEGVFWENSSKELKEAFTKFISLDEHLDHLAFNR